jgi:hypothetical protein
MGQELVGALFTARSPGVSGWAVIGADENMIFRFCHYFSLLLIVDKGLYAEALSLTFFSTIRV